MQEAEQELASTQRPAASKLRDALGGMEQDDLTTRVQRSADWLRRGIDPNSNSMRGRHRQRFRTPEPANAWGAAGLGKRTAAGLPDRVEPGRIE